MAGLPCKTEQKVEFFFTHYCSVVKPTLTSEVIFFNEIVRVATSTNAGELTE